MTQYIAPKGNHIIHNVAPDFWYRPPGGNGVVHDHKEPYTIPLGDSVEFNFGVTPPEPDGYVPSFNLNLTSDEPYKPSFDLNLGYFEPSKPEIPTPTVIPAPFKMGWGPANTVDSITSAKYEKTREINEALKFKYGRGISLDQVIESKNIRLIESIDKPYLLKRDDTFRHIDKSYNQNQIRDLKARDISYKINRADRFKDLSATYDLPWTIPPTKDNDFKLTYNAVRIYGVERIPIYAKEKEILYTPTFDLELKSGEPYLPDTNLDLISKTGLERKPKPYEKPDPHDLIFNLTGEYNPDSKKLEFDLPGVYEEQQEGEFLGYEKTPIQPTGTNFETKAGKPDAVVDYTKTLPWGYGLNNFIIGGEWREIYNQEEVEPPEPHEPIVHKDYGVYRVVNIVNIRAMPSGEVLHFDNFTMTRDLDSFAWTFNFNILDRASYNLVKPVGRNLKSVEVEINGVKFAAFIGKSTTNRSADDDGVVTESYKTTGWSKLKLLSNPYSRKRAFSDTQQRTAAQAVTNELTGSGFTVDWQTTDWNLPAGIHNYQDKTPLGAILSVVNSVGAVIIPDNLEDKFTVKPYYPVSPWDWNKAETKIDRTMNETQFFTIDTEAVPKDNPDGVFVYGEEKGVGVKAIRQGKPGTELLPDIVDKYITANTAGQERARQEVARNSYIEKIPMTTYVDENGIIMPHDLIEFTTPDGDKWRGMVSQVSVACTRIGTALAQKIIVDRFHDE